MPSQMNHTAASEISTYCEGNVTVQPVDVMLL
jgi:hypothetical protein